ncbi:MAG: response regulator transcription factor [Oscillospiraceae bacterium]|nr:response regulator transcription factor [Oscillospiraceae bacterium]
MIFCVEDDNAIRDLMIYTLNASGFEAKGFTDGEGLFQALQNEVPNLILLDIMLPGEDGVTILRRLRDNTLTSDIPVIMETAKGTEYDKVIGLDYGADDYLVKPFGMMEMVSRVKAVLRRTEKKEKSDILQVGKLIMNTSNHTVTANGERVQLTLKEYEILKKFIQNLGLVFTREHLLQSIWGVDYLGETRTVDVHIGTLRTKLGECGNYIQTVRGVGYRMEGQI